MIFFQQFHSKATLPYIFSSYFVTLVSKVEYPSGLGDLWNISLVGSLYNLIAKVMDSILVKVIKTLISPNQSSFIKGCLMIDGVVVVNEVVELSKRSRKYHFIFKVGFEKAHDYVS